MVERFAAAPRCFHVDLQIFAVLLLTDELFQRLRPKQAIEAVVFWTRLRAQDALALRSRGLEVGLGDGTRFLGCHRRAAYHRAAEMGGGSRDSASPVGIDSEKIAPRPLSGVTVTEPPCSSTTDRASRRPSASPRCSLGPRAGLGSSNASNFCASTRDPGTSTSKRTASASDTTWTCTAADSETRTACPMKVANARGIRTRSTRKEYTSSATSAKISTPRSPPKSLPLATASASSCRTSQWSNTKLSCPASTRAASKIVSINARSSRPRRSIKLKLSLCPALSRSLFRTSSV